MSFIALPLRSLESAITSLGSLRCRSRSTTVADLCDHILYLGKRAGLSSAVLDWQVYHEPTYWAELNRRRTLVGFPGDLDSLRREGEPAMFPS